MFNFKNILPIGALLYTMQFSNLGPFRDAQGYYREIPGLTDEEREKQYYRDHIEALSQFPAVKTKKLISIEK